ncbi:unnamed protein product, partial [Closterium sp. NIES-53]
MYIEDLLKNIRTQVLLRLIKPYTRIRIPFVSKVSLACPSWALRGPFVIPFAKSNSPFLSPSPCSSSPSPSVASPPPPSYDGHQELNIPEKDVEQLLVSLILDNRVHGHIDQVNQLLELGD